MVFSGRRIFLSGILLSTALQFGPYDLTLPSTDCASKSAEPVTLIRKIPLPGITGRIDHMALDGKRDRLLVAALASHRVEIVDLNSFQVVHSILGLKEPQGIAFVQDIDRFFVADGKDGRVSAYDGESYKALGSIEYGDDADNLRYSSSSKLVYVGYGPGAIGSFDPATLKKTGDAPVKGHPESFQLDQSGARLYANVPATKEVVMIDCATMSLSKRWPIDPLAGNFPMALDENGHRLFVGTRQPPHVLVLNSGTGSPIIKLGIAGDTDDLFFDTGRRQLYVSCGEGVLQVFREEKENQFRELARIPTIHGARTSLVDSGGRRLFIAAPSNSANPLSAAVWVYQINPRN